MNCEELHTKIHLFNLNTGTTGGRAHGMAETGVL